jgi:predicted ribosome-associated RNA-binding protein Tma20
MGGADLFLQGVVLGDSGLPQFLVGDLMAIKVTGNPFAFAVGAMETSSHQAIKSGKLNDARWIFHAERAALYSLDGLHHDTIRWRLRNN